MFPDSLFVYLIVCIEVRQGIGDTTVQFQDPEIKHVSCIKNSAYNASSVNV